MLTTNRRNPAVAEPHEGERRCRATGRCNDDEISAMEKEKPTGQAMSHGISTGFAEPADADRLQLHSDAGRCQAKAWHARRRRNGPRPDHYGTGNLRAGTDVSDPLPSELREQDPSIKQSQQTHSPSTCSVSPILVMEDVSVCRSCDLLEHCHHLSVIDICDFLGMIVKSSVLKLFF